MAPWHTVLTMIVNDQSFMQPLKEISSPTQPLYFAIMPNNLCCFLSMRIAMTFKPAWWLNNSHLQTMYPALLRRLPGPASIRRERLETPDHDFLDIVIVVERGRPW